MAQEDKEYFFKKWDDLGDHHKKLFVKALKEWEDHIKSIKQKPIDIRMNFEKHCWAKNEFEHSIRVFIKKDQHLKMMKAALNLQHLATENSRKSKIRCVN